MASSSRHGLPERSRPVSGRVEIVLSAVGYGFIGVFGKRAYAAGIAPSEFLTMRFAIAATLLWIFVVITRRRDLDVSRQQIVTCAGLGIFGYACFTTLYFYALKGLSASLTSLLLYTFPVIVTIAAWLLFSEPVGWKRWSALPTVSLGLVLLLWGDVTVTSWTAVLLALGSAVLYSGYILASSRMLRGLDSLVAGLFIMTAAAFACALFGRPSMAQIAAFDTGTWGAILGIATLSTLGPLVLFLRGLEKLSSSEASILSLIEPLTAVVSSAILLGERLAPVQFVGGGLILGALALSSLGQGRPCDRSDAAEQRERAL